MQDVLTTNRSGIAKSYLRMLVDSITLTPEVDGVSVDVEARTDAAVAMISAGSGKGGLHHPDRVLTSVRNWRPRHDLNV